MSTDANTDKQRTGSELKVPECLATTTKMKEYAIDLVKRIPIDRQQYILNFVEDRYVDGNKGNTEKLSNPIAYLMQICKEVA